MLRVGQKHDNQTINNVIKIVRPFIPKLFERVSNRSSLSIDRIPITSSRISASRRSRKVRIRITISTDITCVIEVYIEDCSVWETTGSLTESVETWYDASLHCKRYCHEHDSFVWGEECGCLLLFWPAGTHRVAVLPPPWEVEANGYSSHEYPAGKPLSVDVDELVS